VGDRSAPLIFSVRLARNAPDPDKTRREPVDQVRITLPLLPFLLAIQFKRRGARERGREREREREGGRDTRLRSSDREARAAREISSLIHFPVAT